MSNPAPTPPRSSGLLLHVTSLPSPYGIGDVGPAAIAWIDLLARSAQQWWQLLPLNPIGPGDSPYSSFSSMGANTLLVSPDLLVRDGLLPSTALPASPLSPASVDYETVRLLKGEMLEGAWQSFQRGEAPGLRAPLEEFIAGQADWLPDFSLYCALKERMGGIAWYDWPAPLALRERAALAAARRELADRTAFQVFSQFLLHRQWEEMRQHAREQGIRIIGDLPLFVTVDSVDVWANPSQFLLDADRRPTVVAGAPPDYFSPTGQLWGNALYDWDRMRQDGFRWWIRRMECALRFVDLVRLDHFRGLEAAWHIPAGSETAATGSWQPGPGAPFLERLQGTFGRLPVIAEDLGFITPAVRELRDRFELPGMAVLQFAFDSDPQNPYLPHHHARNMVVYTGTHDNDTTVGWFRGLRDAHRERVRTYTCADGGDIAWDLIRMAWASVASLAIVPLQDILMLDGAGRMNRPGVASGNWRWRFSEDHPVAARMEGLRGLTERYDRLPPVQPDSAPACPPEEPFDENR